MSAALGGAVRGMYMLGENPFLSDPNVNKVRKALAALDFLVVQDIFLTETAEFADVVLPATSFPEKDGTYTNTDRRVQLGKKALTAPGAARPAAPPVLFTDTFPSGKGRFIPAELAPPRELPDDRYPFVLNSGRVLEHWHTGTMTRRAKVLDALEPEPFVEI